MQTKTYFFLHFISFFTIFASTLLPLLNNPF